MKVNGISPNYSHAATHNTKQSKAARGFAETLTSAEASNSQNRQRASAMSAPMNIHVPMMTDDMLGGGGFMASETSYVSYAIRRGEGSTGQYKTLHPLAIT